MATVSIPNLRAVLMIRQAISPRLAIRIRLNMWPFIYCLVPAPRNWAADNRQLLQYCLIATVSTAAFEQRMTGECHVIPLQSTYFSCMCCDFSSIHAGGGAKPTHPHSVRT